MNALFFESNTVGCAHLVERDCATLDRILVDDLIDSSWKGELQNKWRVLAILSKPLPYSQRLQDVKIKLYQDVAVTRGFNYDERSKQADHDAIRFTNVMLYRHGNIGNRSPRKKRQ